MNQDAFDLCSYLSIDTYAIKWHFCSAEKPLKKVFFVIIVIFEVYPKDGLANAYFDMVSDL